MSSDDSTGMHYIKEAKLYVPPPPVGGYCMGTSRLGVNTHYIQFPLTKKPHWLHRLGVKLVLGWEWRDA